MTHLSWSIHNRWRQVEASSLEALTWRLQLRFQTVISSLDRLSVTYDTSVMQYLQHFPRQMIVHRWHICHAIFTTLPSPDDRSQITRLSCNIYNSSLDRWSFTDDMSVMQYLQQVAAGWGVLLRSTYMEATIQIQDSDQFLRQMIVHRWHVCLAICTTDGTRFTHPRPSDIASEATSDILREQFPWQMNVHITYDTSIMEYLQQVAAGWGVLLRSTYMEATTQIPDSDQFPWQIIGDIWHVCHAIFTTLPSTDDRSQMTHLSCNIYNTSLDRWSFTDDTSVMQYLQHFPRQMIVHRWHICHAIFTTLPSTDDRSQMTRLSCNIYNSSLDRWSFTDDMSVMKYLQQFPRRMILHRWHVCHQVFTAVPSTDDHWQMTRLSCNIYNSSLDRWSFTDHTSVMQYLQQFPRQMNVHRWHVCHAIFTTVPLTDDLSQMTRLSCNIYNSSLDRWSFTDDTSVLQYVPQMAPSSPIPGRVI